MFDTEEINSINFYFLLLYFRFLLWGIKCTYFSILFLSTGNVHLLHLLGMQNFLFLTNINLIYLVHISATEFSKVSNYLCYCKGGGGMRNFAGGRRIILWVDGNLRRSIFDHSNLNRS